MWIYNKDKSKWEVKSGSLSKSSFDTYKQELSSTRFYAKCLSGATYLPTNNLSDIYDTLKYKDKKNWFIPISSSQYSETPMPIDDATPIESDNSDLYYDKNLTDYNLTLKNKFTPNKLIKDSIDNYYYVDISTTEQIDITDSFLRGKIDGVRLLKGHKILVKDQKTKSSLDNSTDPDTFFVGNYTKLEQIGLTTEYEYYNEENGIYEFDGEFLIKVSEFDEYENAFRYSVVTKLGTNVGKQFHLSRLLDGYYPNESEPKEFLEHKNWMIRNKLDYNNLCEINYYESLKHSDQEIGIAGITYSIPERTISVGEFGVILDTQNEFGDISNVIKNKFKVDLFSVTETKLFYWTCGQKGTLLKVNKHDFKIEKVKLPKILGSLNCVRFLTDKKGIVVGDLNTILITNDGGNVWEKIDVSKFSNFDYNKCIYYSPTKFFVVGENGVFIEFEKSISGFKAYKRRLSKFTERLEDEYLLVDDINDIISANINWNLEFNGVDTNINDDFIFITTNDNNIIMYDINENFKDFKFLYLEFNDNYGDITNIVKGKSKEVEYEFMSDKFGSTLNDTEYSYTNKLFIEYTSLTNFKVGDMINIYDVSDSDIINDYTDIDTTTGLDFTILEIIPTLSGEKIVFNVISTISTPITETTGKSKLIRTPDEFYFSSDTGVHIFSFENFSKLDTTTGIYNMVNITTLNTINPLVNNVVEIDNRYYNDLFNYIDDVSSDEELILSGNESLLKSYDFDINTILLNDIIDSGFYGRNKSKMLFMNYDIASKLNFFRDNGEYRLPEPIEFISDEYISYVEFENTIVSGNIQSNWINYWQDSLQTFEYNTIDGLSETTKVLFSTRFELAGAATYKRTITSDNIAVGNTPLDITNVDDIDILDLAPEIENDDNINRFYGTSTISAPTSTSNSNPTKELFLYKYLMIVRLYNVYPVDKGDVVRLICDDVDGNIIIETNLIINKIETFGSDNYIYMYTEFNDNIIKSIKENGCYLDNLNKYADIGELEDNFKKHPLSIAYDLKLGPTDIPSNVNCKISAKFNNKTAYYNLGTSVNTLNGLFDMKYTDCFVDFGYSPIYNIYDYLKNINSVLFTPDKEYLAMPVYKNIPLGSLTPSVGYIDTGIGNNNKILLGTDLKFEWESVFIDTFVDVDINGTSTYSTEKLLVMDKYYDEPNDAYVIEFHKKIEFDGSDSNILNGNGSLNIISRRKLSQISDDLRILNNIHKTKKSKKITAGSEYFVYDNELTTKIKTNSYTNILLSDQVTKDNLTAVIYTDDTNELSMNILNLDEEINPVVTGIVESGGKVSIIFKDKHNLSEHDLISILYSGDSVLTADNGCFPNSSAYDPNFFGSHVISIISTNSILLDIPWNPSYSLNKFTVSFTKTDSFLDYTPIDLVDIGVDKKGKTAIELLPENSLFKNNKYELVDVDFNKFRYRLFDGLTINDLIVRYPWILEAEISNAAIGLVNGELTWYSGVWECGRWFEGNWMSGQWMSGDFYGGTWNAKKVIDKKINIEISDKKTIDDESIWHRGRWFDGTWNGGVWRTGRWYDGDFNSGKWLDGIWNDGTFNNGTWNGGIWVLGIWNNGLFNTDNKPSYWINGKFNGGDFGNGIWYNGTFESKKATARFGTESFNSRPSIWHGGNFVSGSFHSFLDKDDNDNIVRSKIHKYSIWNTGNFISGDFYGGVAYNIDFNGTWHGGILEDIQIIDMDNIIDPLTSLTTGKTLTLNGIFRFNIGNEITIMDKDLNTYKTKVRLPVEEDVNSFTTKVETIPDVGITIPMPFEKDKYKVVSEFNNTNWKSGIWTNGVFNSGLWEGGMFYDGIFNGVSI